MSTPEIKFKTGANQSVVSQFTKDILSSILTSAGLTSCVITSTSRTPAEQAGAMYDNIVSLGAAKQKALYGAAGDVVIDVFVAQHAAGKNAGQIKAAMEAKIIALGPIHVSHHCADPTKTNVVDIAPSSIANKPAFEKAVEKLRVGGKISQWFSPRNGDPAYHLEIPQPPH